MIRVQVISAGSLTWLTGTLNEKEPLLTFIGHTCFSCFVKISAVKSRRPNYSEFLLGLGFQDPGEPLVCLPNACWGSKIDRNVDGLL